MHAVTQTTPAAPAHLRGQTVHAIDRLRDHIERIDEGKFYAVDDLAVVLRLLAHPGRGNNLLGRLQHAVSARPMAVLVSQPPELEDALFSFGLVPARGGTERLGASRMPLTDWMSSPFLTIVIDERRRTWTWAEFINAYANKWGGAHLDDDIPVELSAIDQFAFGGFSLSTYLLRAAGVTIWRVAQATWADGRFHRSGKPLSDEELVTFRVTSVGNVNDPEDRLGFGEPQFFAYRGDSVELLMLTSRHTPCRARLALGKVSYDLTVSPENTTALAAPNLEPRIPAQPQLTDEDFSEGRTLSFQGRFLTAD